MLLYKKIDICRVSVFRPGPLQWICREWVQKLGSDETTTCFGGEKYTESEGERLREKGPLVRGRELPTPLASQEPFSFLWASFFLAVPPCFGWSLLLYIPLFRLSSSCTCQSSMLILECTSHRPLFLVLCEPLWPPSHCSGVTSTSKGSGC